jgi:uncharacterized protein YbjT (DUF2867 family)
MRAVVLGATGFIGRALVPALTERYDVVAISRSGRSPHPNVHAVAADATDESAIRHALEGADIVYHLVHSLGSSDFTGTDRRAASVVAEAASRGGVSQIVYLGGLGDVEEGLSPHLRSRAETAKLLAARDVPVTTLRSAAVIGKGSAAFETIVALVKRLPFMIAPKWISTPTQPIALADVVGYLADVAALPEAMGATFDLGGPDVLTYREMIERIGRILRLERRIVEVPVLSPRLSSYWLHLVTPVQAGVARPLVEGLRTPTTMREDRIRQILPRSLVSFDDAARAALSAAT